MVAEQIEGCERKDCTDARGRCLFGKRVRMPGQATEPAISPHENVSFDTADSGYVRSLCFERKFSRSHLRISAMIRRTVPALTRRR